MSHVRKQIRDALVTLVSGLATTADRVFTSRVHPLAEHELPGLRVFVDDEEIELQSIHGPGMLQRRVTCRVECVSALEDGLDDDLDQMALEVEHAVAGDATLGGIFNGMLTPSAVEVNRSGEGAVPIGVLALVYEGEYEVTNNAVDTAL